MQNTNGIITQQVDGKTWNKDYEFFEAGLFNSYEWVESISNQNTTPIFLNFIRNNEVIGKIGGVVISAGRIKGNQIYFTSGPALRKWDNILFEQCLLELYKFSKKKGYSRIHIRPFDQPVHEIAAPKHFFGTSCEEFLVTYHDKMDKIDFGSNFIRNVKKAQKAGATFHRDQSPEVLTRMLELIDETQKTRIEKYGKAYNPMYMVNLNQESLRKILESGMGVLNYTLLNGQINSVLFSLEKNKKIYFLLMGSDETAYNFGLPSLIGYNISTNALAQGYTYYNLGLIPSAEEGGQGLKRFKESQGANVVIRHGYYSYYLNLPLNILNPLIKMSKKLPKNKLVNFFRKAYKLFSVHN